MAKLGCIYEFGPLQFNTQARQLLRDGTPVTLAPKSFELLQILVENHDRALSKSELLEALWPDTHVQEGNLSFQVLALRRALGPEGGAWIETVPRFGYRFSVPVIVRPATESKTQPASSVVIWGRTQKRYLVAFGLVVVAIMAGVLFVTGRRTAVSVLAPVPLTSFPGDEITPSLLAFGIGRRIIKSEFSRKECVFCGEKIPADEHTHHLEICGLKLMMSRRQIRPG